MIQLLASISLTGLIIFALIGTQSSFTLEESPQIAFNTMNDTLYASSLIDTQMEKTLAHLGQCESSNRSDIKVLDINNYYSYGTYQFQLWTFYYYGQQYGILDKDLEFLESENLIYDIDIQRSIATKMIEDGLWDSWYNCLKGIYG